MIVLIWLEVTSYRGLMINEGQSSMLFRSGHSGVICKFIFCWNINISIQNTSYHPHERWQSYHYTIQSELYCSRTAEKKSTWVLIYPETVWALSKKLLSQLVHFCTGFCRSKHLIWNNRQHPATFNRDWATWCLVKVKVLAFKAQSQKLEFMSVEKLQQSGEATTDLRSDGTEIRHWAHTVSGGTT